MAGFLAPVEPIVSVMARAASVVVPVARLVEKTGQTEKAVLAALRRSQEAGEVELWPSAPEGLSAVLTPLVAQRLGLRPTDDGLRWLTRDQRDIGPKPVRQPFKASETGWIVGYDDRPDPASLRAR